MSPTLSLARYLRENLALTGTKIMCSQAGCGACVVTAYVPEASNIEGYKTISINSVIFQSFCVKNTPGYAPYGHFFFYTYIFRHYL